MEALEDDFCDILAKAMRGSALDTHTLADAVNQSVDDISRWVKGPSVPTDSVITRIAEILHLRSDRLIVSAHKKWHPQLEFPKEVTGYRQSPHVSNGYVVQSGSALAIIDPAGNASAALSAIAERGGQLEYILITHRHDDHYDAALRVLSLYPQARLLIHEIERRAVRALHDVGTLVSHGERLAFGPSHLIVHVIPGHVDGLTCFQTSAGIFVGDAIFAGSIGANNGPKTSYREQRAYLHERLLTLPGQLLIFPGHGPITNIDLERNHNPFL